MPKSPKYNKMIKLVSDSALCLNYDNSIDTKLKIQDAQKQEPEKEETHY